MTTDNEKKLDEIEKFIVDAREAMLEFVKRCDEGSIRSTYTYNKFKKILKIKD